MAGLLDGILGTSFDDPKTAATLALAQGLLTSPKAMQGLNGGLLGYQGALAEAKKAKQAEEMRQMQLMQHQMALKQAERQAALQAQQDAFRQSIPSPQFQTGVDALAANGGMKGALAPLPKADPNAELLHGAMKAGVIDPIQYITSQRKDNTPLITKAGDVARDPRTGKVIWQNDDKDSIDPFVRLLKQAGIDPMSPQGQQYLRQRLQKETSHQPGVSVSYGSPIAGVDARGNPVFFQPSKDGGAPAIVPGVSPPKADKPLTEAQGKAAAFASQMLAAEQALQGSGTDGAKLSDQVQTRIAQGAGNFLVTPEVQKTRQAQEQWAEAFLRFKTGAAATEGEVVRNVRTYFPQPGDSAEVVTQKAEMRKQAAHDVRINAGNAQIESVTQPKKQVVRTGMQNGRKVVQYADGTIEYAKN